MLIKGGDKLRQAVYNPVNAERLDNFATESTINGGNSYK